jgi:Tol biopolymer transport system component
MTYEEDKYDNDISRRKNYPKGSEITDYTIGKRIDYFHFNVNPNKRNGSFAVVQYKKGKYRLLLNEDDKDKTLLKFGSNSKIDEINLNYPMMAWDPKGTRLSVLYEEEGRLKLFVFDVITRVKPYKRDLTDRFDQVQDMKYMINSQTLLFSAVKNGHSDLYSYDLENDKVRQITNDVYDDLDPSFVSFPNKTGIIFSSNRPTANTKGSDTSLLNNRFNIFLITDFTTNRPELNQIN